ncbi:SGNH hydrolase [Gloeophyllum trabeum ATCC 11539]|uniref:SGNH hydrolase n=1 Tax=Gloeophyllum trabeum (strain ATCC 11539 / FP-39264 / Madison 617) TaxID=670483 RepID=S7Q2P4_GLOTA|nr:SGNH hydrolase [Gloeophyllum trabeum ATCC 11539]EPQ54261.1 SGNH hydrolase [Gloeophyllum trabeum ATCC 11539]
MNAYTQDCICLLGDSLTQGGWEPHGFAQRLSYVYARKLDVINRGLSGYNTEWAIPVFEQFFAKSKDQEHLPKVQLLTIWFGANDACIPPSPQHVPLPTFSANLSKLINLVKSPDSPYHSPSTRVILITPPPVNTYQRGADLATRNPPLDLDRKFEVTQQYAEAVKEVGAKEGVPVVDIWSSIWEAAGKVERDLSRYLNDGLHLNAEGYTFVYDGLLKTISESYPEIHPDNLEFVFAPWADVANAADRSQALRKRDAFLRK